MTILASLFYSVVRLTKVAGARLQRGALWTNIEPAVITCHLARRRSACCIREVWHATYDR
jgi:hypothetical protein